MEIISENFGEEKWNQMAPHPLQSWQWGEARKKMGLKVIRITDGKDVFQLTIHPLAFNHFIGYLPRSIFPSKEVLEFLYDYAKKNKIIFIKLEPYEPLSLRAKRSNLNEIASSQAPSNDIKLITSPHPLFPDWTQILDITKSEDELLKNMHPKTRYNIRLAQKKGVTVVEQSDEKGFEVFSKLYFETCRRQKYYGHNLDYHKIVWENLKKSISHILIAYYNNTPLAAYELFYFKDIFYYTYGGTSQEFRNLMAANLLMWEAIRMGKKLGAKKFDMWGSLPPNYNPNHDWAGFTRFKSGYGGSFVQMIGSYDLVANPILYPLYNFLYSLRNAYLNLRHFPA